MNIHRGDVVLVEFPLSSGDGSKARPALVIQSDRNNARLTNTIVALITTRIDHANAEPTQLLVLQNSNEANLSGLVRDSAIKCEHLHTVEISRVRETIGKLAPETMKKIDECLTYSLGLI